MGRSLSEGANRPLSGATATRAGSAFYEVLTAAIVDLELIGSLEPSFVIFLWALHI